MFVSYETEMARYYCVHRADPCNKVTGDAARRWKRAKATEKKFVPGKIRNVGKDRVNVGAWERARNCVSVRCPTFLEIKPAVESQTCRADEGKTISGARIAGRKPSDFPCQRVSVCKRNVHRVDCINIGGLRWRGECEQREHGDKGGKAWFPRPLYVVLLTYL